jgi:hypothetical protein
MSEIPTYLSCIVDDGKYAIGQALVQQKKIRPYCFTIGNAYNFTPLESGTEVQGDLVYTGSGSLIKGYIVSKDTFKFSLTVPESAGDFDVGNILLYMQSDDGQIFPFIWAVMKIPYPKQKQIENTVGNRFVFEFIEKIVNVTDILQMDIVANEYASLAGYQNEFDLPIPSQALFQQFVVHEPKFSPVPFVGMRRTVDNSYWGLALYSKVNDPFFGTIASGQAGDSKGSKDNIFWGGTIKMTDDKLPITYGGGTIASNPTFSIGGGPIVKPQ